jgi:pimeloyl-ACP methyl ester carboxylesterase
VSTTADVSFWPHITLPSQISTDLSPISAFLKTRYRLIVPDLRGYGATDESPTVRNVTNVIARMR